MHELLLRPRPDGPIYELRHRRDGGLMIVPYFAEPDGTRDVTESEAREFAETTRLCGGLVIGRPQP